MTKNQNPYLIIINKNWTWDPADYGFTDEDEVDAPICEECHDYVFKGVLVQDTEPYTIPAGFTDSPEDHQTVWHHECF